MPQNWTFLVQCAYFCHIRPNPADVTTWDPFGFDALTLGTYAQIQLMRSFQAVFCSMRLVQSHTPKYDSEASLLRCSSRMPNSDF